MKSFSHRLRRFFSAPDPALVAAGIGGVRSVAITRMWFIGVIGLAPAVGLIFLSGDATTEVRLTTNALVVAFFYSMLAYLVMRRRGWRPSRTEAYVTATFDLTLITATLLLLGFAVSPDRVIHSEAVWAVYLLVIMTSSLRLDVRVCFYMGLMAIGQYLMMVAIFALTMAELMEGYDRVIQFARVTLMLAATALAIGIVNRSRSLMQISGFDSLTGLATRRYFNQRLEDEVNRANQLQRPLSLVLLDLDHFKRVNDEHGHDVGDRVLLQVANLMRDCKRDQDFLARWGGEELAMILPNTKMRDAVLVARRLTDAVRSTEFQSMENKVRITASAGIAELSQGLGDPDRLFALVDARVRQAKTDGRDQIVTS